MENGNLDEQNAADWKAPEETSSETPEANIEVVAFDPPEVPEGGREYNPDTEGVKRHIIEDENKRKIYHHETSETSDWQTKFAYGEDGKIISKEHQQLIEGRQSHTFDTFNYDEESGKYLSKVGEIKAGPDAGHKYEEMPIEEKDLGDGKVIKTITTKILEKGPNGTGTKPHENGTIITKKVYMFHGQWLGNGVSADDGSSSEWPNRDKGVEKLPDWEE